LSPDRRISLYDPGGLARRGFSLQRIATPQMRVAGFPEVTPEGNGADVRACPQDAWACRLQMIHVGYEFCGAICKRVIVAI
jgi:hypothetical protein